MVWARAGAGDVAAASALAGCSDRQLPRFADAGAGRERVEQVLAARGDLGEVDRVLPVVLAIPPAIDAGEAQHAVDHQPPVEIFELVVVDEIGGAALELVHPVARAALGPVGAIGGGLL